MTTPPIKPKGTHFPDLPKLPNPADPLQAFLKSFEHLREQGEEAMKIGDQLGKSVTETAESMRHGLTQRIKTGIPKSTRR